MDEKAEADEAAAELVQSDQPSNYEVAPAYEVQP